MGTTHEKLSEQFYEWEVRGRGWQVWPNPVVPEPPFRPFLGFQLSDPNPKLDDQRRPTFLSSLFSNLGQQLSPKPPIVTPEPEPEPEPEIFEREPLTQLQALLPADADVRPEALASFLRQLSKSREPIAFELLGLPNQISVQFAASSADTPLLHRQLQAHFPDVVFQSRETTLEQAWKSCPGQEPFIVEFGLEREFMFPLARSKLDPFVGIIGALSDLRPDELALFQILFQSVQYPWAESILRSVTNNEDKPLFVNKPELTSAAETKVASPLYAAVVRIAVKTGSPERTGQIACDLGTALSIFAEPQGNELVPLRNDDYPFRQHIVDTLRRQSCRSGILLNSDELIGFVHFPSSDIRTPALLRQTGRTKALPPSARRNDGILLGNNIHLGESVPVRLAPEQRVRHSHIIGASGTGKSTLLFNSISQDIENGEGVAVLDPHGDLIDRILGAIPPDRIDDVILVDPSDEEYSIGFNILNAHSELEKELLASDLVSVFRRLSSSWGDQMQSVLQNAILAFLESSRGGTLADLRRFLIEPAFRSDFLKSVSDPNVLYYWQKGFSHLSGGKSIGPVLTRLEMFLAKKPISCMVSQQENKLDFGHIMDSGKIFLAKLPEGLLGKENSYLLGSVLISKFQQLAMSRQAKKITARRDFWIYIDEFYNFITPSMAEILSGARKYRIGLTLAHHELRQLQRDSEVASAVLSHPCTRICFRLGDEDARKLSDGFSFFEARDLQNLGVGEAIARIERSDFDFNLSIPWPTEPDENASAERRQEVITASRKKYGRLRTEVEAALRQALAVEPVSPPAAQKKPPSAEPPVAKDAVVPKPSPAPPASEPPQPAEAPKDTVSEKQNVSPTPEPPKPVDPPEAANKPVKSSDDDPRDLGRGGSLHITLQKRLQADAQKLGFGADIEAQLKKGSGKSADLVLWQDEVKIAVELPVEGSASYEFGNVKKCLEAGFNRVAVVSLRPKLLEQLAKSVKAALGDEAAAKVGYFTPEEFLAELAKIAKELAAKPKSPPKPNVETIDGYEVESEFPDLTPEERKQREDAYHRAMSEAMRRAKKKK